MSGLLDPEYREVTLGRAEIRKFSRLPRLEPLPVATLWKERLRETPESVWCETV